VKGAITDIVLDTTVALESGEWKAHYQPETMGSDAWINIINWHRRARLFFSKADSRRYTRAVDRLRVLLHMLGIVAFGTVQGQQIVPTIVAASPN
jgi:hypothetical protein